MFQDNGAQGISRLSVVLQRQPVCVERPHCDSAGSSPREVGEKAPEEAPRTQKHPWTLMKYGKGAPTSLQSEALGWKKEPPGSRLLSSRSWLRKGADFPRATEKHSRKKPVTGTEAGVLPWDVKGHPGKGGDSS